MHWHSCSVRKWVKYVQWTTPAECLRGSMVAYTQVTGVRIPPHVPFWLLFSVFIFFVHPLKSVFRLFSNIKPLKLRFTFLRLSGLSSSCHSVVYIRPISAVCIKNTARGKPGIARLSSPSMFVSCTCMITSVNWRRLTTVMSFTFSVWTVWN